MKRPDYPPWEKGGITIEEAAGLYSVSIDQIRKWIEEPSFPCFRVGDRGAKTIINRQLLEEWHQKRCKMRLGF